MSFPRLVYYHALVGGWAALVGWFFAELVIMHRTRFPSDWAMLFTSALVGAFIAGGLLQVQGLIQFRWAAQLLRLGVGLLGGLIGGFVGGLIGNFIYNIMPWAGVLAYGIGWLFIGVAVGSVEGIYTLSLRSLRNGLIGGALGGFVGGMLYRPIALGVGDMSGRAVAFVLVGLCIGLFIGLAQVFFKEAWLTVLAGYRAGRQLLLSQREVLLGTSEKVHLQFAAAGAKGVEPVHLRIRREKDGSYVLEDGGSRTGTFVNGQPVRAVVLRNNDVIQLGMNEVRFGETLRRSRDAEESVAPVYHGQDSRSQSDTLARMLKPGTPATVNMPSAPATVQMRASPPATTAPAAVARPAAVTLPTATPATRPVAPSAVPQQPPASAPAHAASPAAPGGPRSVPRPPAPHAAAPVHQSKIVPAQPAPPQAAQSIKPAAPAQPAKPTQATPASGSARPVVRSACPVCGHMQQGIAGQRVCENCEMRF
jgi:hypothetical protein